MNVTSYNGWPASKDPKAIGINPNWAPLGHRFPGGVKAGDVETVFTHLVEQLHARVEPIDRDTVKDEWGYLYKPSANSPQLLSCHASGTAIDWNATRHPNGRRQTFTRPQAAVINRILDELTTAAGARVVQWRALVADGGCATGTPDEMHFEIAKVTPAQVAEVARRLRTKPTPAPPTPTPQEEFTMAEAQQILDAISALTTLVRSQPTGGGAFQYIVGGSDLNDFVVRPNGDLVQAVFYGGGEERVLAKGCIPGPARYVRDAAGQHGRIDVFGFYPMGGFVICTFDPATGKWGSADFCRPTT